MTKEIDQHIRHYRGLNQQCLDNVQRILNQPSERGPAEPEHNLLVLVRDIRRQLNHTNANLQRISALKSLKKNVLSHGHELFTEDAESTEG